MKSHPFFKICIFLAFICAAHQQQFPVSPSVDIGPLRLWRRDRFMKCIFCMNYDDYNNLITYGCQLRRVPTCVGNMCYMRQHKRPEYFLYTSGCLNLSRHDLATVRTNQMSKQNVPTNVATISGNETQLCEVGTSVNTCICADRDRCNNVTSREPFMEYGDAIFGAVNFDELAHFRHLLPNDPILAEFERERGNQSPAASSTGYNFVHFSGAAGSRKTPLASMARHQLLLLLIASTTTILLLLN